MMPDGATPIQALRTFVVRGTRLPSIADDDDLFGRRGINSMFAMQLVLFIEKQFGVKVEDEDLEMANFRTLSALARLVERKTQTVSGVEAPVTCR
jgi:methoxymalonate biosynthesis acyl carrier protein